MAEWMLARDLVSRPGEHPEQVEAAKEHLREMGGFEGYEKVDLTPQISQEEWDAKHEHWAQQAQREDVTGREKLEALGVPTEKIVECRQNEFPRVSDEAIVAYVDLFNEVKEMPWLNDKPTVSRTEDEIEHPAHYTKGIETIEYIESWDMDFRAANVIKYVTRHPHKGKPLSDLKKARWYIDRMIAELEGEL